MADPLDDIFGLRADLSTLGQPDPIAEGDMLRFLGRDQMMAVPQGMGGMPFEQEPIPDDFWARVAQGSGPQPFAVPRLGQKPTGLEIVLALLSGFGNQRAGMGARRTVESEGRNEQVRQNARMLALHRHQLARERLEQEGATARTNLMQQRLRDATAAGNVRYLGETVEVNTPQGPKRARVTTVPGQVVAGMRDAPRVVEQRRTEERATTRAATDRRRAVSDSTRAAADSTRKATRDFATRKRRALADIKALERLFGDRRKTALENIKTYLRENPDVNEDDEVEGAVLRIRR